MRPEFRLEQKLQQRLVMTPMLQQALKILQLSTLDLQQLVTRELQENPALEEVEEEETEREEESTSGEAEPGLEKALEERTADLVDRIRTEDYSGGGPENFPIEEWLDQQSAAPQEPSLPADYNQEKRDFLEASLTREPTLLEHLEAQLSLTELPPEEIEYARVLIGNLDENGYLRADPLELARSRGFDAASANRILRVLQGFDPPGVAARDLRECLLLQLEWRRGTEARLAYELVSRHFEDLEARRYPKLASALGTDLEGLRRVLRVIAQLEPKPGRSFGGERPRTVQPDVVVCKVEGEYVVLPADDWLPRLRVSPVYRRMLRDRQKLKEDSTRRYLEEKVQSAVWLIRNIEQRRKTLFRVTEAIFRIQRDFLDHGVERLKPLTLKQVADMVGMHESTVSRVTTQKYVQTPRGLFELKYFFTSGLESESGLDVSSKSVKEMIREAVEEEPADRPHSDQRLAEMLRARGVHVARRTVAKYREELRIPPASRRRRLE